MLKIIWATQECDSDDLYEEDADKDEHEDWTDAYCWRRNGDPHIC